MNKKDIDIVLKQHLGSLEVQPDPSSFEASMKKLEQAERKKRRILVFWWCFGLMLVGSVATIWMSSGFVINESNQNSAEHITNTKQPENIGKKDQYAAHKNANEPVDVKKEDRKMKESTNLFPNSQADQKKQNAFADPFSSLPSGIVETSNPGDQQFVAMKEWDPMSLSGFAFAYTTDSILRASLSEVQDDSAKIPGEDRYVWYVGPAYNLGGVKYKVEKNNSRSSNYDGNSGINFTDLYTDKRKEQEKITLSWNAGVAGGFVYRDKWCLQAGLAYQRRQYKEKTYVISSTAPPSIITTLNPSPPSPQVMYTGNEFSNTFDYLHSSVEAYRLFNIGLLKLRSGLGFSASNLLRANTVYVSDYNSYIRSKDKNTMPLHKWTYGASLRIGFIKQISSRVQAHSTINAFYGFNSMFNNSYLIHQKPYGLGVDAGIMIRLN